MKLADIRQNAFAMPLNDPAYPRGPYKFYNREFVIISYRTDPDALREVVPEPLEVAGDTVNYEFIRMPDSTGFGDYTETGQVIPVRFTGKDGVAQEGGYVHAMYLDDNSPIAGGREIWGFPKKLATPKISHESETLVCTLHYGSVLCVIGHHGLQASRDRPRASAEKPGETEFHDQDHPACRLHAAHLRAGALLLRGRHGEGRVVRPRRNSAVRARHVRCRAAAGAGRRLGDPFRDGSDARDSAKSCSIISRTEPGRGQVPMRISLRAFAAGSPPDRGVRRQRRPAVAISSTQGQAATT